MSACNVLLITVDSLRRDHCSFAGYHRETTPTLDDLADRGVSFSQAISNGPSTRSSFPSILTSTYPFMYGGYSFLSDERPFVARHLSDAGFATAAFHSNPYVGAPQNYDVGFDVFRDTAEGSDSVGSLKDRVERRLPDDTLLYRILRRLYHLMSMSTDTSAHARAETINESAQDWLSDGWDREQPFFLWLHYMDVHYPFTPPVEAVEALGVDPPSKRRVASLNGRMHEDPDGLDEADREDLLALYDGEIRHTDEVIGDLLSFLDAEGVRGETAVVVCADHGEGFGEHGFYGHPPRFYDELLRVPMIVDAPKLGPDVVDDQVELLDIGPTIYDIVDVEAPAAVQGRSALDGSRGERRTAISSACGIDVKVDDISDWRHFACRTTEWKCIWDAHEGHAELYDLGADPAECKDVSGEHPDVVERLRTHLEEYVADARETELDLPSVDRSDAVNQRLRDLGYQE